MSGHRVEWKIDKGDIHAKLVCTEPSGAPCRLVCPVPGHVDCECGELPVDVGYCNAVEWISNGGHLAEFYDSMEQEHPIVDGPVLVRWDGSDWLWQYAGTDEWSSALSALSGEEAILAALSDESWKDAAQLVKETGLDLQQVGFALDSLIDKDRVEYWIALVGDAGHPAAIRQYRLCTTPEDRS